MPGWAGVLALGLLGGVAGGAIAIFVQNAFGLPFGAGYAAGWTVAHGLAWVVLVALDEG